MFDYIDPTERDKILNILVECGEVINECILFETGFLRRGHPAVDEHLPELENGLCEQYKAALELIADIKSCYKNDRDEKGNSKWDDVATWFKARGEALKPLTVLKASTLLRQCHP